MANEATSPEMAFAGVMFIAVTMFLGLIIRAYIMIDQLRDQLNVGKVAIDEHLLMMNGSFQLQMDEQENSNEDLKHFLQQALEKNAAALNDLLSVREKGLRKDLDFVKNTLETVSKSVDQLKNDTASSHRDLRDEMTSTHQELRDEMASAHQQSRDEMTTAYQGLRDQMTSAHKQIRDEMDVAHRKLREERSSSLQNLRNKTESYINELEQSLINDTMAPAHQKLRDEMDLAHQQLREERSTSLENVRASIELSINELEQSLIKNMAPKIVVDGGWYRASDGRLYKLFTETVNYATARSRCREFGGSLLAEGLRRRAVYSELVREKILAHHRAWIGYNDIGTEGRWIWEDGKHRDGSIVVFDSHQPDNLWGNEDCGEFVKNHDNKARLNDKNCQDDAPYICEVSV